jgi:hypothetical protein
MSLFAIALHPLTCASVCPACLRCTAVPPYIAPLGYRRRVYRLGDQFRVQARKAPRGRHVRSQGFTTSSRCVLHISPHRSSPLLNVLLSLYRFTAVMLTIIDRTQPQHSYSWVRIGHATHRACAGRGDTHQPDRTKCQEGRSRRTKLAPFAPPSTSGTGQAGG